MASAISNKLGSLRLPLASAVIIGGVAVALLIAFPAGSSTAIKAAEQQAGDDAEVRTNREWGEGELVVTSAPASDDRCDREKRADGDRCVGISYVVEKARGFHVDAFTASEVSDGDVGVGSLVVASSEGDGDAQPAWTAAFGELSDARVARVEITWADDTKTVAPVEERAYLVVRKGVSTAKEARYLAADGGEIAKVPVPAGA